MELSLFFLAGRVILTVVNFAQHDTGGIKHFTGQSVVTDNISCTSMFKNRAIILFESHPWAEVDLISNAI